MRNQLGPTFFLLGAARSGTTALAQALNLRPGVFVTDPKEPHYLALAGTVPRFTGPGDDVTVNQVSVTDRSAYLALYAGAAGCSVRGDASVTSLYYSEAAIATIEREFPEVRLVAVLRDPVERAYSAYLYLRSRGFEPLEDFEAALDAEDERVAAGWQHLWHYTRMGRYADQIEAFHEAFGADRLLVIDHTRFSESPSATVSEVAGFLGAPEAETASGSPGRVNTSGEHRHRALAAARRSLEGHPRVMSRLRRAIPLRLRDRVRRATLMDVPMPPAARKRLEAIYEADRRRLAELVPDTLSFAERRTGA